MNTDLDITVGFSTTGLFTSRFIRWMTGSSCSHSFIAFNDSCLGMRMVMQAESWGFEIRPWKRWIKDNILVAEFEPVSYPLKEGLKRIASLLGTRFDYRSAIVIGIRSKFSRWYKTRFSLNPNLSPNKLTCAEAVIRMLSYGNYRTVLNLDPEITSPGKLLREMLKNETEFKPIYLCQQFLQYDRILKRTSHPYVDREYTFKEERDSG